MKKNRIFYLVVVFLSVLVLSSCNYIFGDGAIDHIHSYRDEVVYPTCDSDGYTNHVCNCGESYSDEIVPAIGHVYEPVWIWNGYESATLKLVCKNDNNHTVEVKAKIDAEETATCTNEGKIIYTATAWYLNMPYIDVKEEYQDKLGHTFKTTVVEPTCDSGGYTIYSCSCGETYISNYVLALGHDYKTTWVWNGYEEAKLILICSHNNNHKLEAQAAITTQTNATCTKPGKIWYNAVAVLGGVKYFDTRISNNNKGEHTYTSKVVAPTCESKGYTEFTCECGHTYQNYVISPLGHDYNEEWQWNGYESATVTLTCKNDSTHKHVLDAQVSVRTTNPTCAKAGERAYVATAILDGIEYQNIKSEVIEKLEHNHISTVVAPTCENEGYTEYVCECGDTYRLDFVEALGHNYIEEWQWNGYESATFSLICENDNTHKHELEAEIELEEINPTCAEAGKKVYTAAVELDGKKYYDVKVLEIEKLEHTYTSTVTEATCESEGYTTYTCECGDSYTDGIISALGHSYSERWNWNGFDSATLELTCKNDDNHNLELDAEIFITTTATCTQAGQNIYFAVITHDNKEYSSFKIQNVEALGHRYSLTVVAPTCEAQGYTIHTCSCGDTYKDHYVEATGHNYHKEWSWNGFDEATLSLICENNSAHQHKLNAKITHEVLNPTCVDLGLNKYTATVIFEGQTYTYVKEEKIPALGHTYTTVVTAPTCEEKGYTTHTCECGDTYVDTYTEALGHSYLNEWVWTGYEEAIIVFTCENDNTHKHELEAEITVETTNPTCTSEGKNVYTAIATFDRQIYTDVRTEVIEKLAHTYTTVVTAPTCEEKGYTTHTCECGDTYVDEYVEELGHDYRQVWTWNEYTSATLSFICQNNKDHKHELEAEITVETTNPTCTSEGKNVYTAIATLDRQIYTDVRTEVIEKLAHTYTTVVTAATCEEKGYTTHTCECGDTYVDTYTEALGHSYLNEWVWTGYEEAIIVFTCENDNTHKHELEAEITVETTNPTCTSEGKNVYTAIATLDRQIYTDVKIEVLEALGHKYTSTVTAATCESEGYTTYTCECGDSYTDGIISALGHSYSERWNWNGFDSATLELTCKNDDNHNLELDAEIFITTTATCTQAGQNMYFAVITHDNKEYSSFKIQNVEALGHRYSLTVVAPTCEAQGYTIHTCSCGDTYKDHYVEATGHNYHKEWSWNGFDEATLSLICENNSAHQYKLNAKITHEVLNPTCVDLGSNKYTATVIFEGQTYTYVKEEKIPALGHTYTTVVTAATCEEKGYTTHTCECGDTYVDTYTEALGHSYLNEWVWTGYEEAIIVFTCENDNTHKHELEAEITVETTNPTCTSEGKNVYTATATFDRQIYTDVRTEVIEKPAHTYTTVVTAPTCEEKGYTTHTCECGDTYVDEYVEELGHDYRQVWTWNEYTSTTLSFICQNNKDHKHELEAEITVETTNPTCTSEGKNVYTATATLDRQIYTDVRTEVIEKLAHTYTTVVTAPTCEEKGYTTHTCECGDTYVDEYVEELGHDYRQVWTWNEYTSATLSFICQNNKDHKHELEAEITVETTNPTCTSEGKNVYTAIATFDRQIYTDVRTEVIEKLAHTYTTVVTAPTCEEKGYTTHTCECGDTYVDEYVEELGHDYRQVWTWNEYTSATLSFICQNNKDHKQELEAEITVETTNPTCTSEGKNVYTATATFDRQIYTDVKIEVLEALGHDYRQVWTWNEYTSATLSFICQNNKDHKHELEAEITVETTNPTCTSEGKNVYTATATFDRQIYTDVMTEVIERLAHTYTTVVTAPTCEEKGYTTHTCECGDTYVDEYVEELGHDYRQVWTWNEYTSATLSFICQNDKDHKHELEAEITVETTNPTCTSEGKNVYTAIATLDRQIYTDVKTEILEALGHDYVETWTWNGYESAKCTLLCKNDNLHVVNLDANIKVETIEPTCEEAGLTTYTAVVNYNNNEYTSVKTIELPALGHSYTQSWIWNNYETATLKLCCDNDSTHIVEVETDVTIDYLAPTCEEEGYRDYQVHVEYDGSSYYDNSYVTLEPLGHSYESSWVWTGYEEAIYKLTCSNDDTHVILNEAIITSETTLATCVDDGVIEYTAKAMYKDLEYSDVKNKVLPALGHTYIASITNPTCESQGYTTHTCHCGDTYNDTYVNALGHSYSIEWIWNDYEAAKLVVSCENDEAHYHEIAASIAIQTTNPTCLLAGNNTYTATAIFENKEYCDIKVENLDALGHSYSDWYIVTEATCEEAGFREKVCSICADEISEMLLPLGHDYNQVWTWSDYEHASLELTCLNDETHHHICDATMEIYEQKPTCDAEGLIEYYAKVSLNGVSYFDYQCKVTEALGHNYESVWVWNGYEFASYNLVCSHDNAHIIENEAVITSVTVAPTCEETGSIIYTAKATYKGIEYSDIQTDEIAPIGHKYNDTWEWLSNEEAVVTLTCQHDQNHIEIINASISSETIPAKCEIDGSITYTAFVDYDGISYYNDKVVVIEKIGHSYEGSWTWNGYYEASYNLTCTHDNTHIITNKAAISTNVLGATCEESGLITYTATAEYEDEKITDVKTKIISALGHKYVETWNWVGYEEATLNIVCSNDSSHTNTLNAEISIETIEPTCTSVGTKKYIATAIDGSYTFTNIKTEEIAMLPHKYVESVYYVSCLDDGYTKYECSCGDYYKEDVTPALGHDNDHGICNRCDHIDPYFFSSTYGYDTLLSYDNGEAYQDYYDILNDVYMKYHENYVDLSRYSPYYDFADVKYTTVGISRDEAMFVWKVYRYDHPVFYWNRYGILSSTSYVSPRMFEEFVEGDQRRKYDELFRQFIRKYVPDCPTDSSVYEQVLYFYDIIIGLVNYKYNDAGDPDPSGYAHSIAGILDETGVVCEGYAYMLSLLLNAVGVENIYVTGENHAYNMVRLDDGNWYWFDATWSDKESWMLGVDYTYFGVNDTQKIGEKGYQWASSTKTFMVGHTPDGSELLTIKGCYRLPERSTVIFDEDDVLEIYESFTVDTMQYTLIGYRKVMLSYVDENGEVVVPETVTYQGITYDVVAIGAMDTTKELPACQGVFMEGTTSVIVPNTIVFLVDKAFDCMSLQEIIVDENNSTFKSQDGVLFTKNMFTLIKFPSSKMVTEYTVPEPVRDIAYDAFVDIRYLTTLYIGPNFLYAGTYAYGYKYRTSTSDGLRYYSSYKITLSLILRVINITTYPSDENNSDDLIC